MQELRTMKERKERREEYLEEEKGEWEITGAGQWTEEAESGEIARDSRKNSRGRKVGNINTNEQCKN